jgi:anti-sigma regulatory factor (Ser/Thr protein kinase)
MINKPLTHSDEAEMKQDCSMAEIPDKITIDVPRIISKLDHVRDSVVEFLKQHDISEASASRIELSVYEAVVNIVEHSSHYKKNDTIHVECMLHGDEVIITINHFGDKFDITKAELPDIEKHYKSGKMRGLGIYFIMTLMDKVEYSHEAMQNTLTMTKKV